MGARSVVTQLVLLALLGLSLSHKGGCLGQQAQVASPPQVESARNSTRAGPMIVCTISLPPMSECTVGQQGAASFRGISIDIFRDVALQAKKWEEGVDYQFLCLQNGTDTAVDYVLSEQGVCDALIAATTITKERTEKGLIWAYPYLSSDLAVVIEKDPIQSDGWNWIQPFTWQLWLASALTALIVPIFFATFEVLSIGTSPNTQDCLNAYRESVYHSFMIFLALGVAQMAGFPARLIAVIFSFMSLILIASYTANLAAFLTNKSITSINSIYDLSGLAVSTAPVYTESLFDRFGLVSNGVQLGSFDDILAQGDLITNKSISAFIIDQEIAERLVIEYPGCKLGLLPASYQPFDFGLAFDPRTEGGIADDFTIAILSQTENGNIKEIVDRYIPSENECLESSVENGLDKISFMEVYGLWIVLAVGFGIALILAASYKIYTKKGNIMESENKGGI